MTVRGTVRVPAAAPLTTRQAPALPYSGVSSSRAHGSDGASRGLHETVVVSLHPLSFSPEVQRPVEPPRLEQTGLQFVPRVLPITIGSTIHIVNLDPVFHNVFSLAPGARFDIGHRRTGEVVPQRIDTAGRIEVFCDIHSSMVATILSLDTPYFTQPDSSGKYAIAGLPPGTYEARVFHPTHTYAAASVELQPGADFTLDFAVTE